MGFLHGKGAGVLLGAFNLSPFLTNVDTEMSTDTPDTTTFGATSKTCLPGLGDGKNSITGYVDNTATSGSHAVLSAALGTANQVLTICVQGLTAIGNIANLALTNPANYKVGTPVGGIVNFSADLPPTGGNLPGALLEPLVAKTNAGNSSSSVDNGAATTNGGVGNLHVTGHTSGTGTYKVQHSSDNSTFVDLITFTAATGTTSEQKSVTGTVNRYTRGAWTGTFVQTAAIAFARK